MKSPADLKILEIGQFCHVKRALPAQTTAIFTGENWAECEGLDHRAFDLKLLPWLRRDILRGAWDLVVCHVPVRPVWDRKHGFGGAAKGLLRRLVHTRTLGTHLLPASGPTPLVMLDFNDEPWIPGHAFALLDHAILYFKRELPTDFAKAFLDQSPSLRTHSDALSSPFVARNLTKLRPMSAPIPEEVVRMALETQTQKQTDVFFVGSINSTVRAAGLSALKALRAEGMRIDIAEGGLSKHEYLARCARAWLTWSPEGYGWECFRHYEASLCLSVPVLSPPGIFRHQPLREGEHAIYYTAEGDGLRSAVTKGLSAKLRLEAMALAARDHVLRHHTLGRAVDHILATALAEIETAAGPQ
jgi:hypothetical protein